MSTFDDGKETSTNVIQQQFWLGVHPAFLWIGVGMGLFTGLAVAYALFTVNLMCIEYPNMYRSLIFAPSFAGVGGTLAGISVGAFWWMIGFVYETCKVIQSNAYAEESDDEMD